MQGKQCFTGPTLRYLDMQLPRMVQAVEAQPRIMNMVLQLQWLQSSSVDMLLALQQASAEYHGLELQGVDD